MKLCLAGTYAMTNNNRDIIKNSDCILESFYYMKEWQIPYIKEIKFFLLDSGAFTFMNNSKKEVNWDQYVESYANFINKYNIENFFELDIDNIVGIKEVERLRNKLETLTKKKCIPVWHKSRGLEYWKKMCEDYDYVAIGGIVTKEIKQQDYKYFTPLLKIAKENNCKVHGLGFTNLKSLSKYPFYSVDSTSWKSGNRFGTLYLFKENKLIQIKKPENKRMVTNEKYGMVEKFVFNEWVKFQKYADKYL